MAINLCKASVCSGQSDPLLKGSKKTQPRKQHVKAKKQTMGKTSRVVVCGMASVGKTAIMEQLIYGNVTNVSELYPTIEDIYVANIETDRGTREKLRFYDTAGLPALSAASSSTLAPVSPQQLARQMLGLTEGYVLVYDPAKPETFDCLLTVKRDIDKNRDKKEVVIIILANRMRTDEEASGNQSANLTVTATINKAKSWANRERIGHFEVVAMDRGTLVTPFVYLASKLNPPSNKSTFPQLSMVRKSITTKPDSAS